MASGEAKAVDSKRMVPAELVVAVCEVKGLDLLPCKPAEVGDSTAEEVRRHSDVCRLQRGSTVQGVVRRAECAADGVRLRSVADQVERTAGHDGDLARRRFGSRR